MSRSSRATLVMFIIMSALVLTVALVATALRSSNEDSKNEVLREAQELVDDITSTIPVSSVESSRNHVEELECANSGSEYRIEKIVTTSLDFDRSAWIYALVNEKFEGEEYNTRLKPSGGRDKLTLETVTQRLLIVQIHAVEDGRVVVRLTSRCGHG